MSGMSKTLFPLLVGAALMGMIGAAQAKEKPLGKLMCIGDSITHGFGAPSYRWPLHKILVDNEVKFSFVGVTEGNKSRLLDPDTQYRGVVFNNRHSAMSSERAYEIAGRINKSGRLGNSNVFDWLLLDKTYTGGFKIASDKDMPDVFVILIGTNDTLSDADKKSGVSASIDKVTENLLGKARGKKRDGKGDMDTIIRALRKANSKARIYVMAIPTWSHLIHRNNAAEDFAAIEQYNGELKRWAKQNKVTFIPVNEGLVDVARQDKPFAGLDNLFNASDHLHPTLQGDLVIAANVAKALGYPGRTAGLERGAVDGETQAARTVEISGPVGDGSENGWDAADRVTLAFTAGGQQSKLSITESAVKWGAAPLYSADFSANTEAVRVAFVEDGNSAQVDGGFYVWLGDRLIGEALKGTPSQDKDGYSLETKESGVKVVSSDKPLAPLAPEKKTKKDKRR